MSSPIGSTDTISPPAEKAWTPPRPDELRREQEIAPAGPIEAGTARRTAPAVQLTQQDFDVAARLVAGAANPYQDILEVLRTAAARRDAALVLAEREAPAGTRVTGVSGASWR